MIERINKMFLRMLGYYVLGFVVGFVLTYFYIEHPYVFILPIALFVVVLAYYLTYFLIEKYHGHS
jgi:hypothetical protein